MEPRTIAREPAVEGFLHRGDRPDPVQRREGAPAAAAIIVAYEKSTGQYGLSDASRAIQTMLLVAWGEGVGSNWTGFGGLENVREEFAIPEAYDVLAVVPLGYPRRKISGKKKRKPLSEVVSAERFGQPLG